MEQISERHDVLKQAAAALREKDARQHQLGQRVVVCRGIDLFFRDRERALQVRAGSGEIALLKRRLV